MQPVSMREIHAATQAAHVGHIRTWPGNHAELIARRGFHAELPAAV
jgi:hypothetical protein